ncbi:MAG: single-stranded-DNA-specific exonuclease RecJ [Bacteroides sp.]
MSVWKVYAKKADFKRIGDKFGINQVVARVIRNRDLIQDSEFETYLYGTIRDIPEPMLMKGMSRAVSLINKAILSAEHIRIIGDYDIDGICSIYILHMGLESMGAVVDYVVPDRITDGYGINENIIKKAHEDGVSMIITCDNGIAAKDAVAYAKSLGMTVIVTDHHDVPFQIREDGIKEYILPPADVIINPKQQDCGYPFKDLCGAAVAWKLITALKNTEPADDKMLMQLLEFAAIATVGDIVRIQGENRIIVKYGLRHIHTGSNNLGLRVLMNECKVSESEFDTYHIGFVVGPCLNASGRLDSAAKAIRLLETKDEAEALRLSKELKELNDERKDMTENGFVAACASVEAGYGANLPGIIIVYIQNCHESVAGIIAGRIREKYYRPAIVFTDSIGDESIYKGSGRSIEGYDMFEKISECSDLLSKFGGHPMAAGMSIDKSLFEEFRQRMIENADISEEMLVPVTWIDVPMPLDYVTEEIVSQLELLAPYGKDNPKPLFADKNLCILKKNVLGKNKNVLKLQLETQSKRKFEAIKFHVDNDEQEQLNEGDLISIVYYPVINTYNGRSQLQMTIVEIKSQK